MHANLQYLWLRLSHWAGRDGRQTCAHTLNGDNSRSALGESAGKGEGATGLQGAKPDGGGWLVGGQASAVSVRLCARTIKGAVRIEMSAGMKCVGVCMDVRQWRDNKIMMTHDSTHTNSHK